MIRNLDWKIFDATHFGVDALLRLPGVASFLGNPRLSYATPSAFAGENVQTPGRLRRRAAGTPPLRFARVFAALFEFDESGLGS